MVQEFYSGAQASYLKLQNSTVVISSIQVQPSFPNSGLFSKGMVKRYLTLKL
jgi:hypothetical protein|tara:strand:- start:2820 stop:2975 length:156 start_codon:yes stop_codon:yes gene_type:complete